MLYICSGHYLCQANTCEHKWTHKPSHISSWRDDCTGDSSRCWSVIDTIDGMMEVGFNCVPYKVDKTLLSLLSYDEEITYDLLVERFGAEYVIDREDYDEDEERDEYENEQMAHEERLDIELPPDMAPLGQEAQAQELRVQLPDWVIEEADYNNAQGLAVGRFMRGGDDN